MNPLIQRVMDEARLTDEEQTEVRECYYRSTGEVLGLGLEQCLTDAQRLKFMKHPLIRILDEGRELPRNKMSCNMRVIGEPTITVEVQEEIKREIDIWAECQRDMRKWHNDSLIKYEEE